MPSNEVAFALTIPKAITMHGFAFPNAHYAIILNSKIRTSNKGNIFIFKSIFSLFINYLVSQRFNYKIFKEITSFEYSQNTALYFTIFLSAEHSINNTSQTFSY